VALAWLLCVCVACAPAPLLNSERIARQFGSYQLRVLFEAGALRISSLESLTAGRPVTRTLAIVRFLGCTGDGIPALHERIANGASIGATFKAAGWSIAKPSLAAGTLTLASAVLGRLMQIPVPAAVAVHAYRFDVRRDGARCHYAEIVELHHPAYLAQADVLRIYARPRAAAAVDMQTLARRIERDLARLPPAPTTVGAL